MYTKYIIRFVVLILVQVLVLNHINFFGYLDPYLYVLFILLLPFEIPGWMLLISAFLLGLGIDLFSGTSGIHAAASVFMAFCRPAVINLLESSKEIEPGMEPGIRQMGFSWFFVYAIILIFLHHLVVFYLEIFRFSEFFFTLYRVLINTLFTLALVILSLYLFYRKR
jgi:hypothetical protein